MKFKKITTFFMVLLFSLSVFLPSNYIVKADTSSQISYSFSSSNIQVGQAFDITVNSSNVSDLYGASIDFNYDPASIQITGIEQGNIFKNSGKTVNANTYVNDTTNGKISFGEMLQGDVSGLSVTTADTLFIIHAKALKGGTTPLKTISDNINNDMSATGNNVCIKLADSNGSAIGYNANQAALTVSAPIIPVTKGTYQENNSAVKLSGNWASANGSSFSGGSLTSSNTTGNYAELTFSGSSITWTGFKKPNRGIATVSIDGTNVATVDCYSASPQYQAALFEKFGLTSGTHTIRITVSGNKNSASSGPYIDIDNFIVDGTQTAIATKGTYEENNSAVKLSGNWASAAGSSFSGGSLTSSKTAGNYAELTFSGSSITWTGFKKPNRGIAAVSIDGTNVATVDSYSASPQYAAVLFQKSGLASGTHTIRVTVSGNKNSASSDSYIDIDNFIVSDAPAAVGLGTYQENDSAVNLNGSWASANGSSFSGGSLTSSKTAGNYAELTFSGSSISWTGFKKPNRGIATVSIDGTNVATVDSYSASPQYAAVLFQKSGLTSGTHTIRVTVSGNKNSASSDSYIDIDNFIVSDAPAAVTAGTYQENNSAVKLNGSWASANGSSFSGGSLTSSKTAGNYAELTFSGSSISWTGFKKPNRGIAAVSIDGTNVATVDCYSASPQYAAVLFQKSGLDSGTHTIRVTVSGNKNSASSDSYIDIDNFIVSDAPAAVTAGTYQENNSAVKLNGSWVSAAGSSFSGGSLTSSKTAGNYAELTFSGSSITWTGFKKPNRGIATVSIDGTNVATVDSYSASPQYAAVLFQKSGLASGTHTIRVTVSGNKNSASSDSYIDIDNFIVN